MPTVTMVDTSQGPIDKRDLVEFGRGIFTLGTSRSAWLRRLKTNHTGLGGRDVYARSRAYFVDCGVLVVKDKRGGLKSTVGSFDELARLLPNLAESG